MTTDSTVSARALASRRNGARSRGPKSAEGRARSARNALKHGLRAQTVLLGDEDPARFARFAAGLRAELAPATPLQAELVLRITVAAWRARRADRLEAALLDRHLGPNPLERADAQEALGAGLVRDGHGPRAHETLVRYRGSALAELFRALGALRLLQAEARSEADLPAAASAAERAPIILPPAPTGRTRETGPKQ